MTITPEERAYKEADARWVRRIRRMRGVDHLSNHKELK